MGALPWWKRVTEQLRRILVTDLRDLVGRKLAKDVGEDALRIGPGAVAVGIVGLEHDVVDADGLASDQRGRVIDGAEPEVLPQHVGGAAVAGKVVAVPGPIDDVLEAVVQHCDPTDPAFAHRDLQVREPNGIARPQPFGACRQRQLSEQRGREWHHWRVRRHRGDAGGSDMQTDDRSRVRARGDDRIPPAGEDRR